MKIAVVEFNLHHDEILPSIVYALNELGVEPDVYVRVRAARRNAFAWAPRLRYRLEMIDATTTSGRVRARIRGTPSRFRRYDALVMNSIEPADVLDAAARIDLPTVAIVHNADQLGADARYARFLADPSRRPMFLAPHIAASVGSALGQDWLAPVYFGEVDEPDPSPDDRTTLCVQGNVQFIRRDYATFLAALEMLARERTDFKVRIVGRSHWKDGRELRAQIDALGLSDRFVFTPPKISHRDYLRLVATSDFVLPLLDPGVPRLAPYYSVKMTSSMSMSIGLRVIPIAEASLAGLYGVGEAAVTYGSGRLLDGIRQALEMSASERADRVALLGGVRSDALTTSVANVARTLEQLGVSRA